MGCSASVADKAKEQPKVAVSTAPAQGNVQEESQVPEYPPLKLFAIKDAFRAIDADNSGNISAKELQNLIRKVDKDLSEQEKQDLLKSIDRDGDEAIDFSEFIAWVLANEGRGDAIAKWATNKGLGDIHKASIAGDASKLKDLILAGGNVNACDITDVTPLHYACRVGKCEAVKALIDMKANLSAVTSDTKRMPLHAAAENGTPQVVEILLAAGAPLDALDVRQRTPLHWACCQNREKAASVLLNAGANVNVKSAAGYTPFAMAQDWGAYSMSNLLASKGGVR